MYSVAPNGVFWSIQGEAHLRGFPMAFLRLAGCSVGCPRCDTDYSVEERLTAIDVVDAVLNVFPERYRDRWVWITGGEPYDRPMRPLITAFRRFGVSIAVATSGKHRAIEAVDWLSVSYHGGYPLMQKYGHEIKLIDGLNGLDPWEYLEEYPDDMTDFWYRYVQPLTVDGVEDADSLQRCIKFVHEHPNWALSRQDHVVWRLP
jgi:7-carboxy-7-deazaguanine synthase